jgi:hypothetical protein
MDRCPVEVCTQIFAHACTDNGFTGRSLSLTSRYIRETSKPTKLQSLSVTTPQQIHGLAHLITHTPPRYRRVRYLFLSSSTPYDDGDDNGWYLRSSTSAADHAITEEDCQGILDAFLRIVRAVALSLVTLHVHFPFYGKCIFLPTRVVFPSLAELSLYGHDEDSCDGLSSISEEETNLSGRAPQYPSLQRLHLGNAYFFPASLVRDIPSEFLRRIANEAPSLTHLCLPLKNLTAEDLLASLGTRTLNNTSRPFGTLPSSIEMVLIDPGPPYVQTGWCGTGRLRHENALRRCHEAEVEDKRVHMLSKRLNGAKNAERYWLDRIEDGEGLWAVSPS